MSVETVSLILATFVSGSLGVAALMHDVHSRTCWRFAFFVGLLFVHDALCLLENFPTGAPFASARAHAVVVLLVGPAAWLFFRRVTNQRGRLPLSFWVYVPLLAAAVVFTGDSFRMIRPWVLVFSHLAFIMAAAAIVRLLARSEAQAKLVRDKLRLRYALWGAVFAIALFVTDALYFSGFAVVPLGTVGRLLYILFLFQTFIRKELITAQELLGKLALFGGISSILSGIYFLLVSWVGNRPGLFFFNTFIASFVIIVLFDPVRKLTRRFTRRLFVHENSVIEEALHALSIELRGVLEPSEMARRIAIALRKCLRAREVRLYVLSRDQLSFVEGRPDSERAEVYASDPLIQYMGLTNGRPFLPESIQNDGDSYYAQQSQVFFKECIGSTRRLGADLVIPFLVENAPLGFIAVGLEEGTVLSHEQLRLFVPVAKQIAMQLKSAQVFSELRNRDKLVTAGELAAGLAHEIKNPLGAIKGAAQLLAEDAECGQREFLDVIVDETDRLSNVLSGFLEYARPQKESLIHVCDPIKVIEHTRTLLSPQAAGALEVSLGKSISRVQMDAEVLKQILLNLLMNAMDAAETHSSEPRVSVTVRNLGVPLAQSLLPVALQRGRLGTRGRSVEIAVCDNGGGIPVADRDKVFLPFYTTKEKGTGLGLAISQRLVESVGGSISIRENRPCGTIVVLHLPALEEGNEGDRVQGYGKRSSLGQREKELSMRGEATL